jgi:hypothetical protein
MPLKKDVRREKIFPFQKDKKDNWTTPLYKSKPQSRT